MSELRLRLATAADDAFFRRIEFDTTWSSLDEEDRARLSPEWVREALDETIDVLLARPGSRVYIAEDLQGEPIGVLWLGVNRNLVTGEDEAWIYNVSVVEERRSQGWGRRLMEQAERMAREQGFAILGLMVASHNERARRLYERMGFRPTNYLMRKRL